MAAQDLARAAIQIVEDRLDGWIACQGRRAIADIVVYTMSPFEGQVGYVLSGCYCLYAADRSAPNYVGMDGLAH